MKKRAKNHEQKEIQETLRQFHTQADQIVKAYKAALPTITARDQEIVQRIEEMQFLAESRYLAPFYGYVRSLNEEEKKAYSTQVTYLTDELMVLKIPKGKNADEVLAEMEQEKEKERFLLSRLTPEEKEVYTFSAFVSSMYYDLLERREPKPNRSSEVSEQILAYRQGIEEMLQAYPPSTSIQERDYEIAQLIQSFQIREEHKYLPPIYYYLSQLSWEEQELWSTRATKMFEHFYGALPK